MPLWRPAGAVDVSRLAADCVFSGDRLGSVVRIIEIARDARARMRENFGFATVYNILAIPDRAGRLGDAAGGRDCHVRVVGRRDPECAADGRKTGREGEAAT